MSLTLTEGPRPLRGVQKAAVLMLALGQERASRLFELMHEDEIREISAAMIQLGTIPADAVERLCIEFTDLLGSNGTLRGSFESTERLLLNALPRDRVQNIMEDIRGPAGRTMWDKLGNVSESLLANYLKNEHPQTIAVILGKIRSEQSARVMALLPEALATDVVFRMLRMESVQRDVLDGVESTLRDEFMSNIARSSQRNPYEVMAEIFNSLERPIEERLIGSLEAQEPEAAERIRALMFTFQDLTRLPPAAIQAILRVVERERLPVALKGASPAMLKVFLGAMSERAAKMLRDDIAALGPIRLRDVDEAQTAIVLAAKDLANAGEIDITPISASEQMVA